MVRSSIRIAAAAALIASLTSHAALADTYTEASFTGAISPGNANVMDPFSSAGFSGVPGDPVTGSFIFDNNLIPGSGSGLQNVTIPSGTGFPASAFNLAITAANGNQLHFDLGNEFSSAQGGLDAAVQYNNGAFNGFAYFSDFAFSGNEYRFSVSGAAFSIFQLVNNVPTGSQLMSGFINIGNSSLTGETPFTPTSVPLPSSFGLLAAAAAALGAFGLFRNRCAMQLPGRSGWAF